MKIVIVGGGTAGWIAANLMVQRWGDGHASIQLIESPDIGIIGVGEGSTPQLKAFMDKIGVSESEWMPRCNATYKLGISFHNWSTHPGYQSYFHPFPGKTDIHTLGDFVRATYDKRRGKAVDAHPDRYFLAAELVRQRKGPHPDENFPFPQLYGYHFDSHLLGQYLREVAVGRGVEHIAARVERVDCDTEGSLSSVLLDDGRSLDADFFVDATGFRGLLMQQKLEVPFRSFADNLFNDAAVVMPSAADAVPHCQTQSTAMKNGWAWDIPLTNRKGNGYVYSSRFCTADDAETELRSKLGLLDSDVEARHLRMKVGQLEQHWHKNCLAVGLSQGFIEPLEATALHLVQETVEAFIRCWEKGNFSNANQTQFNREISARFEGIRDYIVCHYRVSSRSDTDYWRENIANEALSASLKGVLKTWLNRDHLNEELAYQKIEKFYSSLSWHCLLAGYGVFPPGSSDASSRNNPAYNEMQVFMRKCASHYKAHDAQLRLLSDES